MDAFFVVFYWCSLFAHVFFLLIYCCKLFPVQDGFVYDRVRSAWYDFFLHAWSCWMIICAARRACTLSVFGCRFFTYVKSWKWQFFGFRLCVMFFILSGNNNWISVAAPLHGNDLGVLLVCLALISWQSGTETLQDNKLDCVNGLICNVWAVEFRSLRLFLAYHVRDSWTTDFAYMWSFPVWFRRPPPVGVASGNDGIFNFPVPGMNSIFSFDFLMQRALSRLVSTLSHQQASHSWILISSNKFILLFVLGYSFFNLFNLQCMFYLFNQRTI